MAYRKALSTTTPEPPLMPDYALVLTGPELLAGDIEAIDEIVQGELGAFGGVRRGGRGEVGPVMLAPAVAAEWLLDLAAGEVETLLGAARAALEGAKVDVNLVAAGPGRRKRLLIADMDSTIIAQECIDEIADIAGCGAEVQAITERAMRGELNFEKALERRVGLLAGLDQSVLEQVFADRLTLTAGAREVVQTMAAHGAYCALVSGGFTYFTSRIAARAGFHANRANTLDIENGRLSGRVVGPILGRDAKAEALDAFARQQGLEIADTLAVGDGANDLGMITAAGLGVAFRAKPIVAAEADADIVHSDLTALLYLQGYHRSEFIC